MKKSFEKNIETKSSSVMRRIENKEHEDLIKVFEHYKKFHNLYGNTTITPDDDEMIRKKVVELQGTYEYYQILLSELKKCTENYRTKSTLVRMKMSVPVRKMRTIDRNKR